MPPVAMCASTLYLPRRSPGLRRSEAIYFYTRSLEREANGSSLLLILSERVNLEKANKRIAPASTQASGVALAPRVPQALGALTQPRSPKSFAASTRGADATPLANDTDPKIRKHSGR